MCQFAFDDDDWEDVYSSTNATTSQPACHLFKLPLELREMIYDYACIPDYHHLFGRADWIDWRTVQSELCFTLPPLLATCQQTRHEAAPIYFHGVRFLFDELHTTTMFLEALTTEHRAMIRFLGYCDCIPHARQNASRLDKPPTGLKLAGRLECLKIMFEGEENLDGLDAAKILRVCTGSGYCTPWRCEHDFVRWEIKKVSNDVCLTELRGQNGKAI